MINISLLFGLVLIAAIADGDRQGPLVDFYRELGCTPLNEGTSAHPTSYDCSKHASRDLTKCHYEGRVINVGDPAEQLAPCSADCRCTANVPGAAPTLTCARVECPEHMGVRPAPGCYNVYQHDKCCSVKTVCPEKEKTTPATCSYGDKTYKAGEKFYPDEEPCKVCICGENFQGRIEEPFCRDIKCNTQLHAGDRINEGCVPVYFGRNGCCPIEWKCPTTNDVTEPNKTKIRVRTTKSCKFGEKSLQAGDRLATTRSSNLAVNCDCKLPPFITCIANYI